MNGEYFLNHDMGKLFLKLVDTDIQFTFDNPRHTISVRTCVDYLIKIKPAMSGSKEPYEVTQLELVSGKKNTFKKKATENWSLDKVVRYLYSECDG